MARNPHFHEQELTIMTHGTSIFAAFGGRFQKLFPEGNSRNLKELGERDIHKANQAG